jgi:hypothetical protein
MGRYWFSTKDVRAIIVFILAFKFLSVHFFLLLLLLFSHILPWYTIKKTSGRNGYRKCGTFTQNFLMFQLGCFLKLNMAAIIYKQAIGE